MREKIIRYEPAGRGILSIKDAFYLAGSSSCLSPSLIPLSTYYPLLRLPLTFLRFPAPVIIYRALPSSARPFVILTALLARADTSRQPTTTYYSKVISLSRHRSASPAPTPTPYPCLSRLPACLPALLPPPPPLRAAPRPVVIRGDEPAGRFYAAIYGPYVARPAN